MSPLKKLFLCAQIACMISAVVIVNAVYAGVPNSFSIRLTCYKTQMSPPTTVELGRVNSVYTARKWRGNNAAAAQPLSAQQADIDGLWNSVDRNKLLSLPQPAGGLNHGKYQLVLSSGKRSNTLVYSGLSEAFSQVRDLIDRIMKIGRIGPYEAGL